MGVLSTGFEHLTAPRSRGCSCPEMRSAALRFREERLAADMQVTGRGMPGPISAHPQRRQPDSVSRKIAPSSNLQTAQRRRNLPRWIKVKLVDIVRIALDELRMQ